MSKRSVQIFGSSEGADGVTGAEVDSIGEALVIQDMVHHRIHEGVFFVSGATATALANGGTLDVLIQAVSGDLHVLFIGTVGGDATVELFEGTTFTAAGTALPSLNRNRNFALTKISDSIITQDPTITLDGTQLFSGILLGGSGGNAVGGSSSAFNEFIFPAGSVHLARITNISGQARVAALELEFYDTALLD